MLCLQDKWQLVQVCFIKTTNLDGESNLKIRRPVDLKGDAPDNIAEVGCHYPFSNIILGSLSNSTAALQCNVASSCRNVTMS